jgi:hypothetical protein
MINNQLFFWFWGSLLVLSIVIPAYLVQLVFGYVETLFAVISVFWKAMVNVVSGTVAVTNQMNKLAV